MFYYEETQGRTLEANDEVFDGVRHTGVTVDVYDQFLRGERRERERDGSSNWVPSLDVGSIAYPSRYGKGLGPNINILDVSL